MVKPKNNFLQALLLFKKGGLMLNTEEVPTTFTPRIKMFNVNPTIVGGRTSKKTKGKSKKSRK